ncbi:adenosine kinase [Pseudohongiella sp. SYSU M77423]|uniref:adenosine kinase n=1 Tax=Pseudohongiella sp. SYSU M77423 TaxID=3042312 RepID=UPI000C6A065B|nr:adenosine kinase [Pseudohongiella sp. SYSU M77423]MAY55741.1 adenosine kinase [Gammaproteobacteria bacterium]MEC8861181.1 adenosine kinase [Pseudomonadota bacterium]HBN14830.1 adenosine kinase [Pseudohongiella sp.]MBJ54050.1 adenosine kinase [Gammaproteobacteria bacterium]MDH7944071.1 adenosine kinase [Pseudohongiella sp. SYSU M77423]|tara:strand:+ start:397 stop:1392 length:996 start_codon:yes stop_codon:yes gene_type:complete
MTTYDVYGIGNALVDKEFEVDDNFFVEAGIEKGFMTLMDEHPQQVILDLLSQRYPLKKQAGGGSAANTLYAVSQFGGKTFYACKVANDETGDFYVSALGDHNISTNLGAQREPGMTGRCLVMVTPDAERTMLTHLGISSQVSPSDVQEEIVAQAKFVYIEGYLVTSDSARAAAKKLKACAEQHGVKTALTFSDPAMVEYFKDGVNEVLGDGVDLLFCNEQEAKIWADEDDFEKACKKIATVATSFVITRGARGALLFDGQNYIDIAPHSVKAVDTNGAGDMFSGAFLYGITQGMSFQKAGELASLASATVVTEFGPRLDPEQHLRLLEKLN